MATAAARPPSALVTYRDDGPLAHGAGRLGRRLPVPSIVLAALAAPLVLVPALAAGGDADELAVAAAVVGAVVLGALSEGRTEQGRFRWLVPAAIRLTEYAGLLWIGAAAGDHGLPAAFALIAALAFRHYDLVYRLRHRAETPPRWVNDLGLGWEGRLIAGAVMLVLGALPAGFFILAGVFAVVFVSESVAGWTQSTRQQGSVYEEEEDEGQ